MDFVLGVVTFNWNTFKYIISRWQSHVRVYVKRVGEGDIHTVE